MLSTGKAKKPCNCSEWISNVITLDMPTFDSMSATTFALIGTLADLTRLSCLAYPKYGITAVIDLAEALFNASAINTSSIIFLCAGLFVDWMIYVSFPRTFSCISTLISPSLKVATFIAPSLVLRLSAILCAKTGFEFPVNII